MSGLRVVSPGLLTTVQDLGRFGWAHFGVSASGAADPFALRAGNLLVGNAENAAEARAGSCDLEKRAIRLPVGAIDSGFWRVRRTPLDCTGRQSRHSKRRLQSSIALEGRGFGPGVVTEKPVRPEASFFARLTFRRAELPRTAPRSLSA